MGVTRENDGREFSWGGCGDAHAFVRKARRMVKRRPFADFTDFLHLHEGLASFGKTFFELQNLAARKRENECEK